MCGIAGIISSQDKKADLEIMLQKQKHRGPDNTGYYNEEGFAYLGHNRLSIIDLSPAANQPFSDNSNRYNLIFNGEIYNYKELRKEIGSEYSFRTNSDTEVLLASYIIYGEKCLEKLNGMFAFAIWDSKKKSFFAARDRFGVKPLYYRESKEDFCFASEIKTIRSVRPSEFNEKVWANYFAFGSYGLPDETFFQDIFQLPAGHFLIYKEGDLRIKKWYDFVARVNNIEAFDDPEKAKAEYFKLLQDSIKLRFRADVEVGFNISGGVDSSLLLALVNQYEQKNKIKAYTFYTGTNTYDELPWVEKMIAETNNPLSNVLLGVQEVKGLSKKISEFQDEPYGGIPTLAYSKIFEQARKDNVLVLLDGQGMDEQWAGYDYYDSNPEATIQGQQGSSSTFKKECLNKYLLKKAEKPVYPQPFDNQLQNLQYRDLFFTKIPRALRFNDRISMAYSTELREPFLDYRLVEFAFAQPAHFKIKEGVHKYLLREIIKDHVPPSISYTPKRPLQTPQREWLGEELVRWVEDSLDLLLNSNYSHWFNRDEVQQQWKNYKAGSRQSSFHIWQWINTSLLLED